MAKTSSEDFEVLIRRAGLSLSSTQIDQIYDAWTLVEPMLDSIRGVGRERTAEPAHVFRADAYAPLSKETEKL